MLLLVASVALSGCIGQSEPEDEEEPQLARLNVMIVGIDPTTGNNDKLIWSGSKTFDLGTKCLDAMKTMLPVETQQTGYGPMITGLKGVFAPQGYYWSLYIDNRYSTVGIADCSVYSNKLIMWKLEKIEATPPVR